jgi:hypothetical protein
MRTPRTTPVFIDTLFNHRWLHINNCIRHKLSRNSILHAEQKNQKITNMHLHILSISIQHGKCVELFANRLGKAKDYKHRG